MKRCTRQDKTRFFNKVWLPGERDWTAELTVNRETKNVIIAILLLFFLRLLVSGRVFCPFK